LGVHFGLAFLEVVTRCSLIFRDYVPGLPGMREWPVICRCAVREDIRQ
jgi:hypothetical protein